MHIANVTEIRQNASKVIARVLEDKKPMVILQRSKPVAYIIEATTFEEMQKKIKMAEELDKASKTKVVMQEIDELRKKMIARGRQSDSVQIIKEIRKDLMNE
ncbi:MAG: type II toxin-antitoxin system Phd/YefM family antitoxin [Desulfotomaculum sp.]|nr:type II toxin-antitoxin system Phd/YefM family antitoxin [Desulfotomaculum sp.]MCL0081190.1 type II toxin-antitoxin system Phd/YefM family antitoxin [Peptococcaceae bacterium]